MTSIKTPSLKIKLTPEIQLDGSREFKYVGLKRHTQHPEIYKDGMYRGIYVYCIRYLDTNELKGFQFGYDGEYMEALNSEAMHKFWKC